MVVNSLFYILIISWFVYLPTVDSGTKACVSTNIFHRERFFTGLQNRSATKQNSLRQEKFTLCKNHNKSLLKKNMPEPLAVLILFSSLCLGSPE